MEILDCTLRDGGYYTNWDFNSNIVNSYIESTNLLPIDYIELGYRSKPLSGYYGEYFYCPTYLLEKIRELSNKRIAIMIDAKNTSSNEIKELLTPAKGLVDLVRIAVDPKNITNALKIAEEIRKLNFQVGFNIMYMSKWREQNDFLNQLEELNGLVDYLYMVDSYGGVYPEDVRDIFNLVRLKTNVKIGFHGHNNLELALINTFTALECGAEIIDATILGMGRGAGNLKTELLLTALNAKGVTEFDFNALSKAVDTFSNLQDLYGWGTNLPYMVSGANSLPQKDVMNWVGKRFYSFNSIIRVLTNRSKGLIDNVDLKIFSPENTTDQIIIVGGGNSASIHSKAVIEFLKKNPKIKVIHSSSRNVKSLEEIQNYQIHCLSGNEGIRLESIFNHLNSNNRMAILPPSPRTMGTYIPVFLNEFAYELSNTLFSDIDKDSVTAIAIQTALELGAKELLFIGYDGYSETVTSDQFELFNENEQLFSKLKDMEITFCSLTPTKYTGLVSKSIYELI